MNLLMLKLMSKYVKKMTIATLFNYWIYTIIIKIKIGPDFLDKVNVFGFYKKISKIQNRCIKIYIQTFIKIYEIKFLYLIHNNRKEYLKLFPNIATNF